MVEMSKNPIYESKIRKKANIHLFPFLAIYNIEYII